MVDREVDGPVWVVLGRSWGLCVRSWAALGAFVGGLAPSWGLLWAVLGRSWGLCWRSWAALGPVKSVLGRKVALARTGKRSWQGIRPESGPGSSGKAFHGLSGKGAWPKRGRSRRSRRSPRSMRRSALHNYIYRLYTLSHLGAWKS